MTFFLRFRQRIIAALLVIVAIFAVAGDRTAAGLGSGIQVALPVIAAICAVGNGTSLETVGRYAVLEVALQGTKFGLGDAAMNRRPNGRDGGFPSGHAARATYGASATLRECAMALPAARAVVIVAAGFSATSRVSGGKHSIWQVLFGVLYGLGADMLFRRPLRRKTQLQSVK